MVCAKVVLARLTFLSKDRPESAEKVGSVLLSADGELASPLLRV